MFLSVTCCLGLLKGFECVFMVLSLKGSDGIYDDCNYKLQDLVQIGK